MEIVIGIKRKSWKIFFKMMVSLTPTLVEECVRGHFIRMHEWLPIGPGATSRWDITAKHTAFQVADHKQLSNYIWNIFSYKPSPFGAFSLELPSDSRHSPNQKIVPVMKRKSIRRKEKEEWESEWVCLSDSYFCADEKNCWLWIGEFLVWIAF